MGAGSPREMVRMSETVVPGLERRLRAERVGDVMFDRFARGRYATDASHYQVKPHGLWFPVDISTASRATIGGMTANNSCGARSLRYGNTRENVLSIDAVLADGALAHFGPVAPDLSDLAPASPLLPLACDLLVLASSEADEIETRFPKVKRRVGGYNLDSLLPGR